MPNQIQLEECILSRALAQWDEKYAQNLDRGLMKGFMSQYVEAYLTYISENGNGRIPSRDNTMFPLLDMLVASLFKAKASVSTNFEEVRPHPTKASIIRLHSSFWLKFEIMLAQLTVQAMFDRMAQQFMDKDDNLQEGMSYSGAVRNRVLKDVKAGLVLEFGRATDSKNFDRVLKRLNKFNTSTMVQSQMLRIYRPSFATFDELFETDGIISVLVRGIISVWERMGLIDVVSTQKHHLMFLPTKVKETYLSLLGDKRAAYSRPSILVEPPIPYTWKGDRLIGGFHTQAAQYISSRLFHRTTEAVHQKKGVKPYIDFVNKLQAQEWGVNPTVYKVLKHVLSLDSEKLGERRADYFGYPAYVELTKEMTPAVYSFHRGNNEVTAIQITNHRSKLVELQGLEQVGWGVGQPIWFTYSFDNRGRVYTKGWGVTVHHDQVAKALLQAYNGEVVTTESLAHIEAYISKIFGHDKVNADTRRELFKQLEPVVMAVGEALHQGVMYPPHSDVWGGDGALERLAWAEAYYSYMQGHTDKWYLPVKVDGTCNGIQHIAAITRSRELASSVNLLPTKTGKPADIYQECADDAMFNLRTLSDKFIDQVAKQCTYMMGTSSRGELVTCLDGLSSLQLGRGLVKKAVMTTPYNASDSTKRSAIVQEVYTQLRSEILAIQTGRLDYFAVLTAVLGISVAKITKAASKSYLRTVSQLDKLPLSVDDPLYITPLGMAVYPSRVEISTQKQYKHWGVKGRAIVSVYQKTTLNEIDSAKVRTATPPNVIHSYDSCHMINTNMAVWEERPGAFLYDVHDEYGCLPSAVDLLQSTLRREFIKLHTEHPLDKVLLDQVDAEDYTIGSLALDQLDSINQSEFFFN